MNVVKAIDGTPACLRELNIDELKQNLRHWLLTEDDYCLMLDLIAERLHHDGYGYVERVKKGARNPSFVFSKEVIQAVEAKEMAKNLILEAKKAIGG